MSGAGKVAPGPAPLSPEAFAAAADVSRETLDRLEAYAALLAHWQHRINLVSRASLADLWRRHMLDSAQLAPIVGAAPAPLADLGSGAGFPGLVLAILGAVPMAYLVESDTRKAAFLREAARRTQAPVEVHVARAEDLPPIGAPWITARALAPLPRLLPMIHRHLAPDGAAVLLKGRGAEEELTAARESWTMQVESHPSRTDTEGRILVLRAIAPLP